MTKEKAKKYLIEISYTFGTMSIQYLTKEDGKKMREAINVLEKEPKVGHWEWGQYDEFPELGDWYCSECRCAVVKCVRKDNKGGIPIYKYCPNCGAKMEVEEWT